MAPKRKGRPPKFVHDRAGKPIEGLSFHKSTGSYYATYSDPRTYFGKDYDTAIILFRAWQSRQKGETVTIASTGGKPKRLPASHHHGKPGKTTQVFDLDENGRIKTETILKSDEFWAAVRVAIVADPKLAAEKTGLPLDRLSSITPAHETITLEDIGKLYNEKRKKKVKAQTKSDNKRYWQRFCDVVKVKHVGEITPDHISKYNDEIMEEYERENRSAAWANHQFSLVCSAFKHAASKGKDLDNMQRVQVLLGGLERPEKDGTDPHPISVEGFHKWYDAADTKYKAILLVMLNAAMRQKDIADLMWTHVDLDKGTIVTTRKKKGKMVRCCILWQRTIDAIRKYQAEHSHDQKTVFVNNDGEPFASGRVVGNNLRKLRAKAELPDTVKGEDLRDGAYTAAVEAQVDLLQAKILAGHQTGIPDHYLKRGAYMVADACAAIEKHYFPPKEDDEADDKKSGKKKTTKAKGKPKKGGKK